jgi:hypothetical protein
MTPEERQLLGGLFDRIRDASQGQHRDAEAEAYINNAVKAQPYAPYLLAQTVIVQEETMKGVIAKIEELEAKVRELEARTTAPSPQPAHSGGFLGGFGRSVFGAGEAARQPAPAGSPSALGAMGVGPGRSSGVPSTSGISVPPPPGGFGQQAPGPAMGAQPGPWQQQPQQQGGGSSFLRGALGAAAGVAGGMLLANALSGMFKGDSAAAAGAGQKSAGEGSGAGASGSNWDNSNSVSGDDWGSRSSGNQDNWDNSSSVSGDDWDTGDSGGGDDWGNE